MNATRSDAPGRWRRRTPVSTSSRPPREGDLSIMVVLVRKAVYARRELHAGAPSRRGCQGPMHHLWSADRAPQAVAHRAGGGRPRTGDRAGDPVPPVLAGGDVSGRVKLYTEQQLAAIAGDERIALVRAPGAYRFLEEHWITVALPDSRPRLATLAAYAVAGPGSPRLPGARGQTRRAWKFPPARSPGGEFPVGAVDPSSLEVGRPCRLAEGRRTNEPPAGRGAPSRATTSATRLAGPRSVGLAGMPAPGRPAPRPWPH
jgi:hypothetical protein